MRTADTYLKSMKEKICHFVTYTLSVSFFYVYIMYLFVCEFICIVIDIIDIFVFCVSDSRLTRFIGMYLLLNSIPE